MELLDIRQTRRYTSAQHTANKANKAYEASTGKGKLRAIIVTSGCSLRGAVWYSAIPPFLWAAATKSKFGMIPSIVPCRCLPWRLALQPRGAGFGQGKSKGQLKPPRSFPFPSAGIRTRSVPVRGNPHPQRCRINNAAQRSKAD